MSGHRLAYLLDQLLDGPLDGPAAVHLPLPFSGGQVPLPGRVREGRIALQHHPHQRRHQAHAALVGSETAALGDGAGEVRGALRRAGSQQRRIRGIANDADRPFPPGVGARDFRSGRLLCRVIHYHQVFRNLLGARASRPHGAGETPALPGTTASRSYAVLPVTWAKTN